ncbi:MAG: winged helix-turn-helix domain-containing protein [Anaerolineales bacterium]|nr:winged helix-turn-helix domain-containing protein [Anaerolineales bacterium]
MLAGWIAAGESGAVVGLPGSGRSNLLGFLCHQPEAIRAYLPIQTGSLALIPVDINNLPANNLATLYRVIIRSFYWVRDQFNEPLQQKISDVYQETRFERDPFVTQSSLQELLFLCRGHHVRVVLVLNRFDSFCKIATPHMVNTLRGLRDDFKDTLSYIAGMTQEVAYLPDRTVLGEMYELLDNYVCWVGAMNEADGRNLIARATHAAPTTPPDTDVATMLSLTGGFPSLLRAACHWWLITQDKPDYLEWTEVLLAERSVQHRLGQIWHGLTQEEQYVLSELQKLQATEARAKNGGTLQSKPKDFDKKYRDFTQEHQGILTRLKVKGACTQTETRWQIADLLAAYVAKVEGRGRGRIWLDEKTSEVYQGPTLLTDLTALEKSVLAFLIKHPRMPHTKTDLIINTWPDELRQQGVADSSLYQVILTLRKAIEPNPSEPSYLITWRGKPEGGYQFFPEGRPR